VSFTGAIGGDQSIATARRDHGHVARERQLGTTSDLIVTCVVFGDPTR
jgi:hypothetical protein